MCYIVRMPESLDLSRRHYDTASHTTSWKTVSRLCVWQWYPLLGRVGAWGMFSSHVCQYVIQLVLVFLCEKVYFNPQTATLFPVIIHAKEDFQDSPNFGVCVCMFSEDLLLWTHVCWTIIVSFVWLDPSKKNITVVLTLEINRNHQFKCWHSFFGSSMHVFVVERIHDSKHVSQ